MFSKHVLCSALVILSCESLVHCPADIVLCWSCISVVDTDNSKYKLKGIYIIARATPAVDFQTLFQHKVLYFSFSSNKKLKPFVFEKILLCFFMENVKKNIHVKLC